MEIVAEVSRMAITNVYTSPVNHLLLNNRLHQERINEVKNGLHFRCGP